MLEGDLIKNLQTLSKSMEESIADEEKKGIELANAEKQYQIALRKEALIEKSEGTPITFISNFIKGDSLVAELREKRDIAETLYEAAKDRTTGIRLQLRITDAQAAREWSAAGRDSDNSVPSNIFE